MRKLLFMYYVVMETSNPTGTKTILVHSVNQASDGSKFSFEMYPRQRRFAFVDLKLGVLNSISTEPCRCRRNLLDSALSKKKQLANRKQSIL